MAAEDFKYRELEGIELEELAQLMQLMKDVGISPTTLLSYAVALDAIEGQKEHADEGEDMTIEDVLEVNHECDRDDAETADALYSSARLILIKMGKMETH